VAAATAAAATAAAARTAVATTAGAASSEKVHEKGLRTAQKSHLEEGGIR